MITQRNICSSSIHIPFATASVLGGFSVQDCGAEPRRYCASGVVTQFVQNIYSSIILLACYVPTSF